MAPSIVKHPHEVRIACERARARGERVAFVPTMGALHAGHLSLARRAKVEAGFVVASIFVNPTQFGPNEDFARYPRDLRADVEKLAAADVDLVFAPEPADIYPPGDETRVRVPSLSEPLCGRFRPGHFEGVATVVAKLFALVGESTAIFGRKDYQQVVVLRRMARDLFLPVRVLDVPTVRELDGLAMSSRNAYLSPGDRERALAIVRGLDAAGRAFEAGEHAARTLEGIAREPVEAVATSIDYVELRDAETLGPLDSVAPGGRRGVLAVACRVGSTRLIDNLVLGQEPPPLSIPHNMG